MVPRGGGAISNSLSLDFPLNDTDIKQSSIWHGRGTRATSSQLESNMIGIWMNSQETTNTESSAHFVMQPEKADYILTKSG